MAMKDTTKKELAMAKPTKPAAKTQPASKGGYTIQIAAGTSLADANYLAGKYAERGFDAFVAEVVVDGQTYYRVRIGNFDTIEEARKAAKDLKDRFSLEGYWIDKNI
jgi:septal ring-binding cell division protein DamX